MGENRYSVALKNWETNEQARQGEYQAGLYESQASYLRRTAGSFGLSLLQGALAGAASFASSYAMSGMGGGGGAAGGAANAGKSGSYIKLAGADRITS
ncbi:MAG: hypothetical protein IK027_06715, partial [Deltaproteobacteria bacterium]|nr:hypothetical protein [Deltaproteobacteria bacterium]